VIKFNHRIETKQKNRNFDNERRDCAKTEWCIDLRDIFDDLEIDLSIVSESHVVNFNSEVYIRVIQNAENYFLEIREK